MENRRRSGAAEVGSIAVTASEAALSRLRPPPNAGTVRRWRFRRDMVIFVAHVNGVSQRELADVFDLRQSRVSAIIHRIAKTLEAE